ncbi:Putative prolow-density lipoprotein receptor-rela ted protein 1 [Trichuris trichiura]|uniref:Putative prolow-density lipoprotein receptor-rela ted protein 1 n=1 Tax=Trichuris trichiura TaxID=36087 RepID=A0A077ZKL9_TRITR|nr:Putative prolow-density lipoprotein receptor-rela ted protein 1 [Trichuris trichiura]
METLHGSQVLPSIILGSILVIVLILLGLYSAFFRVKVRGQFKHNRMHDELQNPAFLYGEDEEMETFNDEATNFSNPMYDTVYKDTVANVEEHSLLAESAIEAGHEGAE